MSPIPFTPQQLAKSLRVDDDQQKWKVRDLALFQGVEEGVQMIHALADSKYDDGLRDVFACEFAALYLPQFVARYLWLMDVAGTTGSSLSLLHELAVAPAFFGRWVRTNLDEAVRLFVVIARNAVSTWPSMPIVKESNHHGDPTFSFISQSLLILTLIVSHFPPPYDAQPWPSILPSPFPIRSTAPSKQPFARSTASDTTRRSTSALTTFGVCHISATVGRRWRSEGRDCRRSMRIGGLAARRRAEERELERRLLV